MQLIGSVRTTTGLRVKAKLDTATYAKGIEVPDADMDDLDIRIPCMDPVLDVTRERVQICVCGRTVIPQPASLPGQTPAAR